MGTPYWWPGAYYAYDAPQRRLEFGDLESVTPPSGEVLSVVDGIVKTSLRVDASLEDDLIEQHLATATRYCEERIPGGRQFLTATYKLPVSGWWAGELGIPLPPLQSVGSLKYYATDGTLTTLATTFYEVRTPVRQRGTIARLPNQTWPALQCDRQYPIVIQFTCGYGEPEDVPAAIKQAMLLHAQWMYDPLRGDITPGAVDAFERAIDSLLRTESYGFYR